jgi:uncharacterized protein YuzB (UPF0349 family)
MVLRCSSCNFSIDNKTKVCPNCGADVLQDKKSKLKLTLVIAVVIMFVFSSFLFVLINQRVEEINRPKGIEIDGDFTDWSYILPVTDVIESPMFNPNIDIIEYKIDGKLGELSFYLQVEGEMLSGEPGGGSHVDTVYIFIDTDQNPQTGFLINGIGADFMVEVYGWDSEVWEAELYSYTSSEHDWDMWDQEGSADAQVTGSEMEVQVLYKKLGLGDQEVVDALFYIQSWDGFEDSGDLVVSNEEGVLSVIQQGVGPIGISGHGNRLLKLDIIAWNTDILITEIIVRRIGLGTDTDLSGIRLEAANGNIIFTGVISNGVITFRPDILIEQHQPRDFYIVVDIHPNAIAENSIGFRIENNHDIITDLGTVSVNREKTGVLQNDCSYILSIPENVIIDGAFADWEGKHVRNDISGDVPSDSLDMINYGVSCFDDGIFFYLRVNGEMLSGEDIPHRNDISESEVNLDDGSPKTGEDIIYIFIDTIEGTGYIANLPIQADYMIEIQGRHNQVLTCQLFHWDGSHPNDWTWFSLGSAQVGIDTDQLEVAVGWEDIGVDLENDSFEVFFMVTDWRGESSDFSMDIIDGHVR